MIVRIRFGSGARVGRKPRKQRRFAVGMAGLLTPAALLATVLGLWRIAADLSWTGSFAIPSGFFSHWQVWLGAAVILQLCAHLLNRYARNSETAAT
jgi:hypothetical protein